MNIILNSDDFGICKGMNYAVIDAHLEGVLNSTTALVGSPYINHAANLAKEYPNLGIGIHLSIDFCKCFSKLDSILEEDGNLKRVDENTLISVEDVLAEWELQIEEFQKIFGYFPTHFDSHHHAHLLQNECNQAIKVLKEKYNIPVRGLDDAYLIDDFYDTNVSIENLIEYVNKCKDVDYKYREIMIHNSFCDLDLIEATSYNTKRMDEHRIITSSEFKQFLSSEGIKICSYKDGQNN